MFGNIDSGYSSQFDEFAGRGSLRLGEWGGGGGGGGIGRDGRTYGAESLACLRCCFSASFSGTTNSASGVGSVGYSFGLSTAATFSDEDDIEGFLVVGGGGGRSAGAWGRGGGVSRGRTILGLAWVGGVTAPGGRLLPCFPSTCGGGTVGGFGAGTFFETRRKTLGFPGDPAPLSPTGASDVVDTTRLSVGFGTTIGSGWWKSEVIAGKITMPEFIAVTVDGAVLGKLAVFWGVVLGKLAVFCGVLVTELLPRFSASPVDKRT